MLLFFLWKQSKLTVGDILLVFIVVCRSPLKRWQSSHWWLQSASPFLLFNFVDFFLPCRTCGGGTSYLPLQGAACTLVIWYPCEPEPTNPSVDHFQRPKAICSGGCGSGWQGFVWEAVCGTRADVCPLCVWAFVTMYTSCQLICLHCMVEVCLCFGMQQGHSTFQFSSNMTLNGRWARAVVSNINVLY